MLGSWNATDNHKHIFLQLIIGTEWLSLILFISVKKIQ